MKAFVIFSLPFLVGIVSKMRFDLNVLAAAGCSLLFSVILFVTASWFMREEDSEITTTALKSFALQLVLIIIVLEKTRLLM